MTTAPEAAGFAVCAWFPPLVQAEFSLPEPIPADEVIFETLRRTAGMYRLRLSMTLQEYQSRWWAIVDVQESVCAHTQVQADRLREESRSAKGKRRRDLSAQADDLESCIHLALRAATGMFLESTEPLLAAYERRCPDDEWFGLVLAERRSCEAYGSWTLRELIRFGDEWNQAEEARNREAA